MNISIWSRRRRRGEDGVGVAGLAAGAVALTALCCAGPALLAGGVLTALGSWLTNPWVVAAGIVTAISATVVAVRRRCASTLQDGQAHRPDRWRR